MKRSPIKRESNKSLAVLQRKLWELCKIIIRKKYGNECYSCGKKNLQGLNWHTGHLIPRSTCGAFLKYDLRNLRPQCYRCNIHMGGNGALFSRNMILREGDAYVDQIFRDRNLVTNARQHYSMLYEKYKLIIEDGCET